MKKKILITGGTGFIGSHLAETFIRHGHKVRVFDRYNPNYNLGNLANSNFKSKIDFVFGDIRDYDSVLNAAKNCDIIFHLAALIGIPYSYKSPLAYIKTNIEGTKKILELGNNLQIKKFIYTSSAVTLGEQKGKIGNEKSDHRGSFLRDYEESKFLAEQVAFEFNKNF